MNAFSYSPKPYTLDRMVVSIFFSNPLYELYSKLLVFPLITTKILPI